MPVIEKNGKRFVDTNDEQTPEQIIARLRLFHHYKAANLIEELLEYKWKYEELDR